METADLRQSDDATESRAPGAEGFGFAGAGVASGDARRLEQDLREARRRLAESRPLAELGELVAFVAHEIRAPLAGIAATADLLRGACDEGGEQGHGLSIILDEARRVERTVRNLVDFARCCQARVAPTDLAAEVERVLGAVAAEAVEAGVTLRVGQPAEATLVLADREILARAFANLAGHAIQVTPRGGTVTVRVLRPEADSAYVVVEFADAGPGIAPDDLPKVFDPFFVPRAGGGGLALAAASRLVERLDGHITVESELGRGSCFAVYLRRVGAADWRGKGRSRG
jgi:signal transduction histidine kinase